MAGTDRSRDGLTGGPAIILVEPQLGENIGTAARAMLNCGLDDLRLVCPRDGWPSDRAVAAASGADQSRIEERIAARVLARKEHRFADADRIRAELAAEGIILEDRPDGTTEWRLG